MSQVTYRVASVRISIVLEKEASVVIVVSEYSEVEWRSSVLLVADLINVFPSVLYEIGQTLGALVASRQVKQGE